MAAVDHRPKWGDEEEDYEDYEKEFDSVTRDDPQPDGSILRTIVEYKTNEKGQKVKLVKKLKIYKKQIKINKTVQERRKWRKFGDCAHAPPGPEKVITSVTDEVFLESVNKADNAEKSSKLTKEAVNLGIVCRNCGKTGDHWTLKCPYFKEKATFGTEEASSTSSARSKMPVSAGGEGKYVAPRGGSASSSSASSSSMDDRRGGSGVGGARDETATIRVTNLSEDTKETDLADLFRSFGPISRIYLAKDKTSGLSKGFAFINFVHHADAAKAIQKLSGYGYDHLILHLEWAKPSNK